MLLQNYTRPHANILNKLSIPEITDPFSIKVLWFRSISFDEKTLSSAEKCIFIPSLKCIW